MSNQDEERNLGSALWQSQQLESPRISLEFVRHQITKLNTQRRRYVTWMYAIVGLATLLTIWSFLVTAVKNPALGYVNRTGVLLLLLGSVCALLHVRRVDKALVLGDVDTVTTGLGAYRRELQRSRDYNLEVSWRWALPVLPACIVLFVGILLYDPYPYLALRAGLFLTAPVVALLIAYTLAKRKARELQSELDALETLEK